MFNNDHLPVNINVLITELKSKGIPDATIENINWKKCIHPAYCTYKNLNTKKFCLAKIQNKKEKFCSIHRNKKNEEIDDIEYSLKNISIKDELDEEVISSFTDVDILSESNYTNTNSFYDNVTDTTYTNISTFNYLPKLFHLNINKINKLHENIKDLLIKFEDYEKNL